MATITLKKTFKFDAAHRLAKGYPGKCKNIHGHSWKGILQVSCHQLDRFGMGIDYGDIQVFLDKIEDHFDHKLILYKEDDSIISFCQDNDLEVVVFEDENPTSEKIAQYVYGEAVNYFSHHHPRIHVDFIEIAETCTASCIWSE